MRDMWQPILHVDTTPESASQDLHLVLERPSLDELAYQLSRGPFTEEQRR